MKNHFPKLKFVYSYIYDRVLSEYEGGYDKDQYKEIIDYIPELQKRWKIYDKKIYNLIEQESGIKWNGQEIKCYVVRNMNWSAISDPLTLRIEKDLDLAISRLTHELIHIILFNNEKEYDNLINPIEEKYPKENWETRLHILVNKIQLKIIKKIFPSRKFQRIVKEERRLRGDGIEKAWEIVLGENNESNF